MTQPTPTSNAPIEPDWAAYYAAVAGRPPRDTLLYALAQCAAESMATGFAIDLGSGDGRDTAELLRQGWRVLAIDGEPEAINYLRQRAASHPDRLTIQLQRFESLTLPDSADLINASFCLPFCPPEHFHSLWQTITSALRPGGRLCGQLFGDRDSWAMNPHMTFHTREQVEQLLIPFQPEHLHEEEHSGKTALGEQKYWHIYHIVAKKR